MSDNKSCPECGRPVAQPGISSAVGNQPMRSRVTCECGAKLVGSTELGWHVDS